MHDQTVERAEDDAEREALGHGTHVKISRGLTFLQRAVEYVVAAGLFVLSFITVSGTFACVVDGVRRHVETNEIVSRGLDTLLLTLILLELLHTVLSHAPLMRRLSEFLIIGVFSAVRYGLEVVASTDRGSGGSSIGDPRTIATSLVLDATAICLLVLTLSFVRKMNAEKRPATEQRILVRQEKKDREVEGKGASRNWAGRDRTWRRWRGGNE